MPDEGSRLDAVALRRDDLRDRTRRCAISANRHQASTSHRGSAIRLDNVVKAYGGGGRAAVDGVSLDIAPGEFIVLLGPSGCGKTTLLKMVNRLFEPTAGTITIDGMEVHDLPAPALRRKIGYVIQQTGLFPHMRIRDNIAVVPRLLKWDKGRIRDRVHELLELVGLPPDSYGGRYPSQLSGGEQQRVGLARALAAEPSTMLMDEPFGALDAITRTRLQDEVTRIHRQFEQTILFVTHDVEEAVRLADRIVVMRDGQIVQVDVPLQIVSNPADDFVADLVGARDVLRRLSLISVQAAIEPIPNGIAGGEPTISGSARLREALGHLVDSGAERLVVLNPDGKPDGILTLDSVQRAASGAGDGHPVPVPVASERP